MTTIRERCLAILKERNRFGSSLRPPWRVIDFISDIETEFGSNVEARKAAAELNATHRLKMLCEEIAEMHVMLDLQPPGTGPFTRENKALKQFRNAILAIGADE